MDDCFAQLFYVHELLFVVYAAVAYTEPTTFFIKFVDRGEVGRALLDYGDRYTWPVTVFPGDEIDVVEEYTAFG